jgi:hypothetical protein
MKAQSQNPTSSAPGAEPPVAVVTGFRLPAALLAAFEQPFEVFLGEPA